MPATITITDTVSIASMGDGWADPEDVAATFSSQLEDVYFTRVTQLFPEAQVQVVVNYDQETLGSDLEVAVADPDAEDDPEAMQASVYAAIKDTKALLGQQFLTNGEAEEEQEEKDIGDE
jgi:hypothetical protein